VGEAKVQASDGSRRLGRVLQTKAPPRTAAAASWKSGAGDARKSAAGCDHATGRDLPLPLVGGVKVDHRRAGTAVPHTGHQLSRTGSHVGGEVVAGMRPCTMRPVWADRRAAARSQCSADRLASTKSEPASAKVDAIARPRPAEPPGDQCNLSGPRQSGRRGCGDVELTFQTGLVDHLGMIAEVHLTVP